MEALSCYLFIHLNHIPFTRTSLSLIFYFIIQILLGSYSKFGPAPRDPVSMLRSYLLSIKLKITSITDWVSRLKECPLYAIISGFSPDDVPGIGTFYDFFRHIWNSEQKHLSVQLRHKKKKTSKGKNTGKKLPISRVLLRHGFWIFTKSILFQPLPSVPFPWSSVYTSSSSWVFLYRMDSSSLLPSPLPVMVLL